MSYDDEDLLPLSALSHFLFCQRRCALVHIEQIWAENAFTAEGRVLHRRAHSGTHEKRAGVRTEFGVPIRSLELGLSGKTDAVEYQSDGLILIVEYKRGKPKDDGVYEVQLCAQAICLEEMRQTQIEEGALYFGKSRRRRSVPFDSKLRERTKRAAADLHALISGGLTPSPSYDRGKCPRCSLLSYCMPKKLSKPASVDRYFSRMLNEEAPR
jgi:CRISPR-associated exonuclease Cas4